MYPPCIIVTLDEEFSKRRTLYRARLGLIAELLVSANLDDSASEINARQACVRVQTRGRSGRGVAI